MTEEFLVALYLVGTVIAFRPLHGLVKRVTLWTSEPEYVPTASDRAGDAFAAGICSLLWPFAVVGWLWWQVLKKAIASAWAEGWFR